LFGNANLFGDVAPERTHDSASHPHLHFQLFQPLGLMREQNLVDFGLHLFVKLSECVSKILAAIFPFATSAATEQFSHPLASLFVDRAKLCLLVIQEFQFLLDILSLQQHQWTAAAKTAAKSTAKTSAPKAARWLSFNSCRTGERQPNKAQKGSKQNESRTCHKQFSPRS
jgi:hypothetical protein